MVSYIRETTNNDMMDSSGLKAKRALQPESTMYFIETLSAVILMNSNFAAQIILFLPRSWSQQTAYSTKLFRKIVQVERLLHLTDVLVSNVPRGQGLGFIASLPR